MIRGTRRAAAWMRRHWTRIAGARGYGARLAAEHKHFASCENVHELPAIFHYWSNRYLRPMLEPLGFGHPDAFFARYASSCLGEPGSPGGRIASIGSGNGDMEVRLAKALRASGHDGFTIECLDINAQMLARGAALARAEGVERHVVGKRIDVNRDRLTGPYDAILANQSLHHIVGLERLFDGVAGSLAPHGRFVVSDMIGRNGHQRWPEARAIVDEFWDELPDAYRFHRQLRRHERRFLDWDCATSGFEGIRSQDILPLCVERFGFDLFVGFANVVDPFVDRGFGHNFDATAEWDRAFIDRVHERDERAILARAITPTHMFAVMTAGTGAGAYSRGLAPREAIRRP
jgi:SAM-dependent methyltransferase